MKRLSFFILTAAFLIAASFSFNVRADGQLDQILANMQQAAKSITSLDASLEQVKQNKQIGGRELYRGKIFFKHKGKADKVRINYDIPAGQAVSVVGDEISLYQPNINQMFVTSRKAQAAKNQEFSFIATPYSSVPELKSRFQIAYKGEERLGSAATSVLELTPKGRSSARKITLWVNQADWLPIKYQVIETNGDVSTFTLSNIRKNPAIGDGMFTIKPKSGTKVVRQ